MYLLVNVVPNAGVCVVPKAVVAGFAKVLPKGADVFPKPVVWPNPVFVVGCPNIGLAWPKRLVVWVAVGVENENPVDWGAPKPVAGWAGFPKSEVF